MTTIDKNLEARFIYFAGVDGCGKSSVIEELIKEYKKKGIKARRVWLRFNYFFTRPVLLYCRIVGLTRREKKGDKIYSIHDFHKSKFIAFIVQYLHFIDTALAYFFKVWIPLKFTDDVIFCDKFVYDILVDFVVETKYIGLLDKRIAGLFLKIIPRDASVIFLEAGKDEIIRRKPIVLVDDEDYDFKYGVYELIKNKFSLKTIVNDDLDGTVSLIRTELGI